MDQNKHPPPYKEFQDFVPEQEYQPQPQPPHAQPPLYPPMPQPQQTTVFIQTGSNVVQVGSGPIHTRCPCCHAEVLTSVKRQSRCGTHCCALILCLCICWPCVCLPYCMESNRIVKHYCPNCKSYIGTYG